jgi:hypothetical protein
LELLTQRHAHHLQLLILWLLAVAVVVEMAVAVERVAIVLR